MKRLSIWKYNKAKQEWRVQFATTGPKAAEDLESVRKLNPKDNFVVSATIPQGAPKRLKKAA